MIAVGLGALVVLVLIVFVWPALRTGPPEQTGRADRNAMTWVVRPGETLTLSAEEIHPDDAYMCSDTDIGVNLEVAADGSGTVYCGGPPGS